MALWKKDEISANWQLASCSATEFENYARKFFIPHNECFQLDIPSTCSWVTYKGLFQFPVPANGGLQAQWSAEDVSRCSSTAAELYQLAENLNLLSNIFGTNEQILLITRIVS